MASTVRVKTLVVTVFCAALAAFVLGCGGGSDGSSEDPLAVRQQIEEARKEGAREARQRDRIEGLEGRVKRLEREKGQPAAPAAAPIETKTPVESPGGGSTSLLRTFHTPNVSCEIVSDGARCSVAPTNQTFVFEAGEPARVESGSSVPDGAGEPASWDTTVSAGSITCRIPPEDEPSGITCTDTASGHGFEASRVPDRQSAY